MICAIVQMLLMDITVDTSALIAVVSNEPSRALAIQATAGHNLIAPSSVHWEMGNALSAMIKRGRVTVPQAHACVDAYLQIPIRLIEVDLKQALGVVNQLRVYAYDAYLLVCAMQMATPLLTLDRSLQSAAAEFGIEILEV
jgi:predicted nucleic acid-binding protein